MPPRAARRLGLGYYDNYLVDNDSCVIVGVQATAARMSQEMVAAQNMLTRFAEWSARICGGRHDLWKRGVLTVAGRSQHYPVYANPRQHRQKEKSILRSRAFHLRARTQSLYLPAGQSLNYGGRVYRNHAFNYIGTRKRCGACAPHGIKYNSYPEAS